jgi:3-oxoacyl-[acyl-carrier-protein] synthase II
VRADASPVVTGLGVVSPIGATVAEFWRSLLTGRSGAGRVRSFDASPYPADVGCEVRSELPPAPSAVGRVARLAAEAGRQALAQAGIGDEDREETALCVGTTMGESCWLEAWPAEAVAAGPAAVPADELLRSGPDQVGLDAALLLGLRGLVSVLAGACAAGNYALGRAAELVRLGRAERVLAGGTDAFSRTAYTGFAQLGALARSACRPFSVDRDGIVLGEGAAMLLVESRECARARGAPVLAELAGYGLSADAHHIVSPEPGGDGLRRALEAALDDAGVRPADVDYVCAHGTGTPANDQAEVAAARAVFGNGGSPPMSSIKALTGHGLGAASALEAVACVQALRSRTAPPTWNFTAPDPSCVWDVVPNGPRRAPLRVVANSASAFGGNNAVVVFR